jgi:PemK-like protein.
MNTGTIVLIPFPFAELTNVKVRPAIVIANTKDKHQDLILCAISSVIPSKLGMFEMKLFPDSINQLRVPSIIRIDRIATLKRENIITTLGKISEEEVRTFVRLFRQLVD